MKSTRTKSTKELRGRSRLDQGLARKYCFDYSKSKANRFAERVDRDAVVVILDSDVAKVFSDAKRVNALLRATIAAVKKRGRRRAG